MHFGPMNCFFFRIIILINVFISSSVHPLFYRSLCFHSTHYLNLRRLSFLSHFLSLSSSSLSSLRIFSPFSTSPLKKYFRFVSPLPDSLASFLCLHRPPHQLPLSQFSLSSPLSLPLLSSSSSSSLPSQHTSSQTIGTRENQEMKPK